MKKIAVALLSAAAFSSSFANTWALGVFISQALIIDVVLALAIIPILIYMFKSKYVFGNKK